MAFIAVADRRVNRQSRGRDFASAATRCPESIPSSWCRPPSSDLCLPHDRQRSVRALSAGMQIISQPVARSVGAHSAINTSCRTKPTEDPRLVDTEMPPPFIRRTPAVRSSPGSGVASSIVNLRSPR